MYPSYPQYMTNYQQFQHQVQPMQSVQPEQVAQQPVNQGLLWVQGESGAKSYLVAPNATVLLMDSEGTRFYLKSTDNAGMPSLRTFEYTEILPDAPQASQSVQNNLDDKYVTRAEYDRLKRQYEKIMDRLDDIPTPIDDQEKPIRQTGKGRKGANTNE